MKQSSSVLQGESPPPPPLLHSLGFRQLRSGLLLLQTIFRRQPADAKPTSTQVGPAHPESTQVGPARPADDKPTSTQVGPAHPESTQVGPARPADDLQTPSLRRPKWVLLIQSRPKWVLFVLQTTCRRQAYVVPSGSCSSRVDPSGSCSSCRRPADDLQTPSLRRPKWVLLIQSRPKWVLLVQSSTLLSLVHLGDGPLTRLSVPRTTYLARGVITLPARDVGSLAIPLKTRTHRLRIANNGTINRTMRIIFVLPRWIFF